MVGFRVALQSFLRYSSSRSCLPESVDRQSCSVRMEKSSVPQSNHPQVVQKVDFWAQTVCHYNVSKKAGC